MTIGHTTLTRSSTSLRRQVLPTKDVTESQLCHAYKWWYILRCWCSICFDNGPRVGVQQVVFTPQHIIPKPMGWTKCPSKSLRVWIINLINWRDSSLCWSSVCMTFFAGSLGASIDNVCWKIKFRSDKKCTTAIPWVNIRWCQHFLVLDLWDFVQVSLQTD